MTQMQWQPIETAPKDGTAIVLYEPPSGDNAKAITTVGWWDSEYEYEWVQGTEDPVERGAWTDGTVASWHYQETKEIHPTHWMPLPPPPETARSEP